MITTVIIIAVIALCFPAYLYVAMWRNGKVREANHLRSLKHRLQKDNDKYGLSK